MLRTGVQRTDAECRTVSVHVSRRSSRPAGMPRRVNLDRPSTRVILWWSAIIPSISAVQSSRAAGDQVIVCERDRWRDVVERAVRPDPEVVEDRSDSYLLELACPTIATHRFTIRYTWFRYATKSSRNAVAWSFRTSSMVGMRVSRAPYPTLDRCQQTWSWVLPLFFKRRVHQ